MFSDSASKEALKPGPRKLEEAWKPPCPREGSKEAEGLAQVTQLGDSRAGTQTWPCLAARRFPLEPVQRLRAEVEPALCFAVAVPCVFVGVGCGGLQREGVPWESHPAHHPGLSATEATRNLRLATSPVNRDIVPTVCQALSQTLGTHQ